MTQVKYGSFTFYDVVTFCYDVITILVCEGDVGWCFGGCITNTTVTRELVVNS